MKNKMSKIKKRTISIIFIVVVSFGIFWALDQDTPVNNHDLKNPTYDKIIESEFKKFKEKYEKQND